MFDLVTQATTTTESINRQTGRCSCSVMHPALSRVKNAGSFELRQEDFDEMLGFARFAKQGKSDICWTCRSLWFAATLGPETVSAKLDSMANWSHSAWMCPSRSSRRRISTVLERWCDDTLLEDRLRAFPFTSFPMLSYKLSLGCNVTGFRR